MWASHGWSLTALGTPPALQASMPRAASEQGKVLEPTASCAPHKNKPSKLGTETASEKRTFSDSVLAAQCLWGAELCAQILEEFHG